MAWNCHNLRWRKKQLPTGARKITLSIPCTRMMSRTNTARTAMAINNIGVTMLEQGNFYDALKVFQDALLVSEVMMTIPSVDHDHGETLLLHHSAQLAQQQQKKKNGQPPPPIEPLQISPCDDGDVATMKNVLECVSAFIPIRLQSREFYDPQEQQQQQDSSSQHDIDKSNKNNAAGTLMLAMVVYNQGLAYLLAHVQDKLQWCNDNKSSSISTGTGGDGTEHGRLLLRGAVGSFSLAHALIHGHLTKHYKEHSYDTLWILYVLAMVHKTLMWLSRLDHQDFQAVQAREMLSRVLLDIRKCQEHLHALNVKTSNHAIASAA